MEYICVYAYIYVQREAVKTHNLLSVSWGLRKASAVTQCKSEGLRIRGLMV